MVRSMYLLCYTAIIYLQGMCKRTVCGFLHDKSPKAPSNFYFSPFLLLALHFTLPIHWPLNR
jgi:hypothetical protein